MSLFHSLSLRFNYKHQLLSLRNQYESVFHAYHFVCYTGMLKCLCSCSHQKPTIMDIYENDALRCSLICVQTLNKTLIKVKGIDVAKVLTLSRLCSFYLVSLKKIRSDAEIAYLVDVLYIASLVMYQTLGNLFVPDQCVYKKLELTEDVVHFALRLSPPVDLSRGSDFQNVVAANSNLLRLWNDLTK